MNLDKLVHVFDDFADLYAVDQVPFRDAMVYDLALRVWEIDGITALTDTEVRKVAYDLAAKCVAKAEDNFTVLGYTLSVSGDPVKTDLLIEVVFK